MHKHHCGECDHTLNNFLNKAVKTGPVYSPLRASCKGSAIALAGDIRSLSFNQRLFFGGGGGWCSGSHEFGCVEDVLYADVGYIMTCIRYSAE